MIQSNWMNSLLLGLFLLCPTKLICAQQAKETPLNWLSPSSKKVKDQNLELRKSWDKVEIRVFHFSSSWQKIFNNFTEETGLSLVMPDVPAGHFSQQRRELIPASVALKIYNQELEKQGYRALVRNKYLIVLKDETFRPQYAPYRYSAETKPVPKSPAKLPKPEFNTIQQVKHEQPEASVNVPSRMATVVEPQTVSAVDLARRLYAAYADHAQLVEDGPLGLPAFRATYPSTENSEDAFYEIGIDEKNNRIVIDATRSQAKQLVALFENWDQRKNYLFKEQVDLPLLANERTRQAVEKLPVIVAAVLQEKEKAATIKPPFLEKRLGESPKLDNGNTSKEELPDIIDRLRSNVSIEALDELGLLILRGNLEDVEGVMQIIQSIEHMSVGSVPEIHLRHLEFVNCEAIAELLNSVYESIKNTDPRTSRKNAAVNVIPVVQPNSVLIIAPSKELEPLLSLIDELDRSTDPEIEAFVVRLKFAPASKILTILTEFYEERGGLGTQVRAVADERTNSLIIQAHPRDLAEIKKVIKQLDQDESHAVSRLKLYPLANASAEELAEFLNNAIEDIVNPRSTSGTGGQAGNANNEVKSIVLEFLAGDESQADIQRSGILTDVRISADRRTNSLAVTAPIRSHAIFEALIKALDSPSETVAEVKVFELVHADAADALEILEQLFDQSDPNSPVGMNLAGATDSASTLLPVKFSVDIRTNSVIAVGGNDALTVVEAILLRLDSQEPNKRISTVIHLSNSSVADVADAINQFLEAQRALNEVDPNVISTIDLINREVIVIPELISNKLLISATPEYFDEIHELVLKLDETLSQVIIQALIVEVELDNIDEFGIELGFQDSILFNRSLIDNVVTVTNTTTNQNIQTTTQQVISQDGNPGFLFNNPSLFPNLGNNVNSNNSSSRVGPQGLSNFGVGRVSSGLDYGGLVLSANSDSVNILIRALAEQRNVHVLSRPQIRTVDKQLAQIQVGQEVPVVNGVNITANGLANPNIEYKEAGIILSVTPRINPDGTIILEVVAEKSAFQEGGVPIFVDATTGNTITSPVKNIQVARTTVSAKSGETIVIGGMITEKDSTITRKVPWLGDLPIIGRAFRFDSTSNKRTELLIFLTPRIIRNQIDNEYIKEVESKRLHFFRDQAEEMHGPLFAIPEEYHMNTDSTNEILPPRLIPAEEVQPEAAPEPFDTTGIKLPAPLNTNGSKSESTKSRPLPAPGIRKAKQISTAAQARQGAPDLSAKWFSNARSNQGVPTTKSTGAGRANLDLLTEKPEKSTESVSQASFAN
ncbi:MAG: hypothetical protein JKY95_03410 [Planctomycetaceae bacterium]|nr:hypothetical protein [Planctomycetaceae bacterium]